jgi:hypothetical protein
VRATTAAIGLSIRDANILNVATTQRRDGGNVLGPKQAKRASKVPASGIADNRKRRRQPSARAVRRSHNPADIPARGPWAIAAEDSDLRAILAKLHGLNRARSITRQTLIQHQSC